jgi:hypothetical protein
VVTSRLWEEAEATARLGAGDLLLCWADLREIAFAPDPRSKLTTPTKV